MAAAAEEVERLLASVRATDKVIDQLRLTEALADLGQPAVESLIAAVADPATRWAAVTALGLIGAPEAIAPIIPICKDADPTNRGAAVMALGRIGGAEIVDPMIDVVNSDEGEIVNRLAIEALGSAGGPDAIEFLAALVNDTSRDKHDRRNATKALGSIGGGDAIAHLRSLASNDGDEFVRRFAAEAVSRLIAD